MANRLALDNGQTAAQLDPAIARSMGIGNSTGLGMAPFLLNRPLLFNNWISAREEAICLVRKIKSATPAEIALIRNLVKRSKCTIEAWHSQHLAQVEKMAQLRGDVALVESHLKKHDFAAHYCRNRIFIWTEEHLTMEGQEWFASLLLEPYGAIVDHLADQMAADTSASFRISGATTIGEMRAKIADIYGWALETDWKVPTNKSRAWYVSEEKLEPCLGERFEEPIEENEQPLAPGRNAAAHYEALLH